jgi:hypothetical protein
VQPRVTDPELLSIQEELLRLEPIFHNAAFGSTHDDYDARMVEDYWQWALSDPCCRALGPDTYALTYHLDQSGRPTRRLTVWRRNGAGAGAGWQIVYHQGTVIE